MGRGSRGRRSHRWALGGSHRRAGSWSGCGCLASHDYHKAASLCPWRRRTAGPPAHGRRGPRWVDATGRCSSHRELLACAERQRGPGPSRFGAARSSGPDSKPPDGEGGAVCVCRKEDASCLQREARTGH